jgi:hypothetical protein
MYVYTVWLSSALSATAACYAVIGAFHPLARNRFPLIPALAVVAGIAGLLWLSGIYWPVWFPSKPTLP